MPCSDVTEVLRVELDAQDRLASYALIKKSCGRAVGERSLLAPKLVGLTANQLMDATVDLVEPESIPDETEQFLALKHFFAVQAGLRVLLGLDAGGAFEPTRVARVWCEGESVWLEAELVVDVIVEKIEACGRCSGCATRR
jgi:hypothetical protein